MPAVLEEQAEAARNAKSKEIGKAKASKDEALAARLMEEVGQAKVTIEEAGRLEAEAVAKRDDLLARLPNVPFADVPLGEDEHGNKVVRTVGTPRSFNFKPKDHADLGEAMKMMDFEAAARMGGARFVVLKGQLARLERALTQAPGLALIAVQTPDGSTLHATRQKTATHALHAEIQAQGQNVGRVVGMGGGRARGEGTGGVLIASGGVDARLQNRPTTG